MKFNSKKDSHLSASIFIPKTAAESRDLYTSYKIDALMAGGSIHFHKPRQTIGRKQFLERIVDWHEEGNHIVKILTEYDQNYRKKICSKCTEEQQKKRNCLKLDMYTSEGIQLKHCSHMNNARVRKHKQLIRKHMQLHPSLQII